MPSSSTLIKIELFKIFRRPTFWVGIAVMLALITFILVMSYSYRSYPSHISYGPPADVLIRDIEHFERELEREGISEKEKEHLEEAIKRLRLQLEMGYERAREMELQERLSRIDETLAAADLTTRARQELEWERELVKAELGDDHKEVNRLYMVGELWNIEEELKQDNLSPSRQAELENRKKGLELEMAQRESDSTGGRNAYAAMLSALFSISTFFLPLMLGFIAADQIAGEYANGTLNLSLIRPVSRIRLFLTRYGALLIAVGIIIPVIALYSFTLGGVMTSFEGFNDLMMTGVQYTYSGPDYSSAVLVSTGEMALKALGMLLAASIAVAAIALFFSAIFRSSVLPVFCVIGMIIAGNMLTAAPEKMILLYRFLPFIHYNAMYHFMDYAPAAFSGFTAGFSLLMLALYTALFIAFGVLLFKRKDVLA